SLQQQAAAAGGAVHFVLGNHETMVLYNDLRYVNPKYLKSAQLLGRSYPALYGPDSTIGQWLRTRPVLLRIGDTLFLHG
ncbi:metallophosphoesterase, partial [Mycobacterium tuberculosis]